MTKTPGEIVIAAAIILEARSRMLVVRKHSSSVFQQPGGKIDPGETPEAALCREVLEEVGIALVPAELVPLGLFSAPAANEPGHRVISHVFAARSSESPKAAAEIAQVAWLDLDDIDALPLAQLSKASIVPLARELAKGRVPA